MIKIGKHLFVKKLESNRFQVESTRGLILGIITFDPHWRRYVYEPNIDTYYSSDCGIPLFEFIAKLDKGEY